MKRILATVIACLMLTCVFASCESWEDKIPIDKITENDGRDKDKDKDKDKNNGNTDCKHTDSISATCKTRAICLDCKEFFGELNKEVHVGRQLWESTPAAHKSTYECCGAVAVTEEKHEWQNGACAKCGYECVHTDKNKDHACDTCRGVVGEHTDKVGDKDHKCDYCGKDICCDTCQELLSKCVDADKNHACDECSKEFSSHSDIVGDGDHKCDYCNNMSNSCVDNDRNHECDECKAKIGEHIDVSGDGNHICEYCGEALSEFIDEDDNGFCDECTKYRTEVDWKPLYRYEEPDGSIVITPDKRNEWDELDSYSITAYDGFELYYYGENRRASALYVDSLEGWTQRPKAYDPEDPFFD